MHGSCLRDVVCGTEKEFSFQVSLLQEGGRFQSSLVRVEAKEGRQQYLF